MRDAGEVKPHLHTRQCAGERKIVQAPQMSYAEYAARNIAASSRSIRTILAAKIGASERMLNENQIKAMRATTSVLTGLPTC